MCRIPRSYEIYRHFKGNLYQILAVAQHSETGESLVIYQALYGTYQIYARPLSEFTERLDEAKYPDAVQTFRFELLREAASSKEDVRKEAVLDREEAVRQEEISLDPKLMEFLDADTCGKRLAILSELSQGITDEMITTMAIACDVEVPEGSPEERLASLKSCLIMRDKYEGSRLRER